ncbi:tyrosine-protein phosphatase 10D-like isoform X3 [Ruditapes philippinarum]|uniref:tyrosine-protein phosphatase 10D-like isoform X3 n=1 Tax=Ruditapes philippinarum TaxID=129788 RepID=UPI00295AA29A|nr:tyrosine-protein phosphatase 10D-like isoform X3 [Ruditapes philippinarum]
MVSQQLYFVVAIIFAQVYSLYGSNSTVNVAVTEYTITLQWAFSDLNATYNVIYGIKDNSTDRKTDSVVTPTDNQTGITHLISGLFPGQTYDFEVQLDSVINFSNHITTKPLPVEDVQVTSVTSTSAYITWLPSNQSIQDSYKVFVQGVTDNTFQYESTSVNGPGFLLPGLVASNSYSVTVVTYSQGQPSNSSQVLIMNTAPLPPRDLTVVAIDIQKLNITWETVTDSIQDSFMLSYTYNSTNGNNLNELTVNVTCNTSSEKYCELLMPGIPGQVYEIRVYSKLNEAVSDAAMTMHSTIPLPVIGLDEILSNDSSIHLTWTLPDNLDFDFRHYIIHVMSQYGSMTWELTGDKLELPLTNLHAGSQYNISIIVSTGYETSPAVKKTFYTHPVQVDSLTNNIYQDTSTDSFIVYWTINSTANYDNFIINIDPKPENTSFPITLAADVFNYTFTNLAPGRGYTVSLVTKLAYKESEPVNNTFRTLPNKPTDASVQVVSGSEVKVDWKAAFGNLDGYRLTLTYDVDSKVVELTDKTLSYTFYGLVPGTQYVLKIESQSAGMYSEPITSTFTTNPSAVSGLRASMVNSDSVTIVWDAPTNTSFDTYEITVDPAHVTSPIILNSNITDMSYKISGLTPGQFYTISMVTVSSGVYSERLTTTVITGPLPVMDLMVEPHGAGLKVSWKIQSTSKQSGFIVTYQEMPAGVPVQLPVVESVENQSDYSVTTPDLFPGGTYKVKVQAWQNVSGESAGSPLQEINGTTKPKAVENITATILGTDVIDLDWSAPSESIHSHYVVKHRPSLRNPNVLWVENSTLSTNLTLPDLMPGERYEIEVYAVSDSVRSNVRIVHVTVPPLPPPSVTVLTENTSTTSVTLQWLYKTSVTYVENWVISYFDNTGIKVNQTVPRPATAKIVEATVDGLVPGFKYDMAVQAVVQEKTSSPVSTPAVTKPVNNIAIKFETIPTNSSFIISYEEISNDYFDEIVFTVLNDVHRKPKAADNKQVEFTSLDAGTLYTVKVQTVSGGEKSEIKSLQAQTLPNAPIVSVTPLASSMDLTITRPSGGVDKYRIECFNPSNVKVKDETVDVTQDVMTLTIDNLMPYTTYNCKWTSLFSLYQNYVSVSVDTQEGAPSVVRDLTAMESAPTQVDLSWTMPEFQNGIIIQYTVSYLGHKGTDTVEGSAKVPFPTTKQIFTGLKAGYTYTFHVVAETAAGESMAASIILLLNTYKPPYKDGVDKFTAMPKSVDSKIAAPSPYKIVMNFTNVFSDKYGEVNYYTVIATEDKDAIDIKTKPVLPGWKVARQDASIKAYQVISNCSTFFDAGSSCDGQFVVRTKRAAQEVGYKVFEIGSETGCENKFYCNGPLKPDTTYYILLRAYTTMEYADTPFSDPIRTAALPGESKGANVGGIVGGVIAAIVAIAIIIIIVVIMRRRMDKKSNMYRHNPGEQMTHRSSLTNRKTYGPVNLANFKHHIQMMKADSDFKYAEQFEDLKDVGRGQPCSAAELACNRGKNRFTNILPYDHSRVKLLPIDDEEGSDYINANYIPGHNSRREYIVSQGALPATRDDFWRMLWEQNCRNIVMLTKCVEKGREKCDKYWPSGSDAVFYGDLQVATLNETLFPDWTVTEFRVSLGDQSRQIRHFHFTSWPDFGVPKKEQVLVRFVRMVREKLMKDAGPIIVHCSAGVGRSGTFVVLDRLLQHIKTNDSLDIYNTVAELRKERVWMVQTEQQYICIHNCILCVLEGREDEHIYDNVGHANIAFEDDEGVDLN